MYNPSDEVLLEIHWHRSKIQIIIFAILVTVTLCVIMSLSLSFYWQAVLIIVLLIYVSNIFFKDVLLILSSSFIALRKTSDNWFVYNEEKGWQIIKLCLEHCVISPWGIVFVFFCGEEHRTFKICLLKSDCAYDDFHRLLVYFRYGIK